jgi:hypothetical protein
LTISSPTRIAGPFNGTGSASVFSFTFKVFSASDLDVIRLNSSTGVETTLVLTTDYTVTLNGNQNTNPGGSVTLVAGALASGFTLTITSDIANLQPTDLTNQGGFYPEVITDSLDRATIQIQQMFEDVGRSLKGPISDGSLNMELPTSAIRASKFLYFDSNGLPSAAAGTNTGNNTSPVSLTLTANNANSGVGRDVSFFDYTTQTMRVASGGNLILGDQNAAGDTTRAFDIYNYANGASASSQIRLITHNVSGSPSSIGQLTKYQTGAFSIQNTETNAAAHMRFDVGSSERMRIDSSGRVGIGMTPTTRQFSLYSATDPTFQIVNSTTGTAAGDGGIIYMSGNDMLVTNQEAANLKLETSGTTRVTIDSAGDVFVGQTTALISGMHSVVGDGTTGMLALKNSGNAQVWQTGPASGGNFYVATSAGTGVFVVSGATAWTATSDERKKDIIEPIANGLNKVDSLRAVIGKFKTDSAGVRRSFLIAQDVQAVLPEAVDADSDADGTLGLRYTETIPLLVAAIKELKTIVDSQAARIAALEASA